jgi:small-conductance mechanosensitive channel
LVIVPNSILFKNPVTIRTDKDLRRVTVICGVAYDVDLDTARSVISDAVKTCGTVEVNDKSVQIFATEFASSSINFEVTWWTGSTPLAVRASRDEVVAAVKRALDDAGIEIPFPYRTLTFKEPLPISGSGAHVELSEKSEQS